MLQATVKSEGMMCQMCEAHVNDAVRKIMPKSRVSSSHKDGKTVVIADKIDAEALKSAIEAEGYRVIDIEICEYQKQSFLSRLFKK